MSLALVVQLLAYAMTFASMWLAGRHSIWSPIIGLVSGVPWGWLAWDAHLPSLLVFEAVTSVLAARQLWLWHRHKCTPTRSTKCEPREITS